MYHKIWLVNSSLSFYLISLQREFSNRKRELCHGRTQWCCVFLQTKLQHITAQEHLFGEFALTPLNFGPCTSTTDTLTFTYHFPSVSIPISHLLNYRPIFTVDNFQHFERQINILDNPPRRRCYHFWFPYTLQSSGNLLWCRETEAHIPLFLVCSLPV